MKMTVNRQQGELLRDFGTNIGLQLAFDGGGQCQLLIDDVLVSIRAKDAHFVFYGLLGEFSPVQSADFWKLVLSFNADLIEQRRGAITVDLESDKLLLLQSVDVSTMGPGQLSGVLRDLVDQVNDLIALLHREVAAPGALAIDSAIGSGDAGPHRAGDMFHRMA